MVEYIFDGLLLVTQIPHMLWRIEYKWQRVISTLGHGDDNLLESDRLPPTAYLLEAHRKANLIFVRRLKRFDVDILKLVKR